MPYDPQDPLRHGLLSASALRAMADQAAAVQASRVAGGAYHLQTGQGEVVVPADDGGGSGTAGPAEPLAWSLTGGDVGFGFVGERVVIWPTSGSKDHLGFTTPAQLPPLTADQLDNAEALPVLVCPAAGWYLLRFSIEADYDLSGEGDAIASASWLVATLWRGGTISLASSESGAPTPATYDFDGQVVDTEVFTLDSPAWQAPWAGPDVPGHLPVPLRPPPQPAPQRTALGTLQACLYLAAGELLAVTYVQAVEPARPDFSAVALILRLSTVPTPDFGITPFGG